MPDVKEIASVKYEYNGKMYDTREQAEREKKVDDVLEFIENEVNTYNGEVALSLVVRNIVERREALKEVLYGGDAVIMRKAFRAYLFDTEEHDGNPQLLTEIMEDYIEKAKSGVISPI